MKIFLIRHGMTQGNIDKKYIGITDQPLTKEGIELLKNIKYPKADIVYSSPMKRCIQTAQNIYPHKEITVVEDLREMDFGIFEDKTHYDLVDNKAYQMWLKKGGLSDIPEGEGFEGFTERCKNAFIKTLNNTRGDNIAFVIHGGSIMAIMYKLAGINYFDAMAANGRGYICEFENNSLRIIDKI